MQTITDYVDQYGNVVKVVSTKNGPGAAEPPSEELHFHREALTLLHGHTREFGTDRGTVGLRNAAVLP